MPYITRVKLRSISLIQSRFGLAHRRPRGYGLPVATIRNSGVGGKFGLIRHWGLAGFCSALSNRVILQV